MTVDTATPVASYTISSAGPYTIPWAYEDGELRVWVERDGAVDEIDPVTHWTVSPAAGSAGTLTLTEAALAGWTGAALMIERRTVAEQGWQGTNSRELALEASLDRAFRAVQDLVTALASSLRLTGGTPLPPIAPPVAGETLIWDGDQFIPAAPYDAQLASAFATTLFGAADAAAARSLMGLAQNLGSFAVRLDDWNTGTSSGWYRGDAGTANAPVSGAAHWALTIATDASNAVQIAARLSTDQLYYRRRVSGGWQAWVRVIDSALLSAPGSAPLFAPRAWGLINGTGTVAVLAAGNLASVTDLGAGDYRLTWTTAQQDANYAVIGSCNGGIFMDDGGAAAEAKTTTTARISTMNLAGARADFSRISFAVVR